MISGLIPGCIERQTKSTPTLKKDKQQVDKKFEKQKIPEYTQKIPCDDEPPLYDEENLVTPTSIGTR